MALKFVESTTQQRKNGKTLTIEKYVDEDGLEVVFVAGIMSSISYKESISIHMPKPACPNCRLIERHLDSCPFSDPTFDPDIEHDRANERRLMITRSPDIRYNEDEQPARRNPFES